jgi:hypothetical protein
MMSQSMNIRFTPNQKDYARVLRLFLWQRMLTRVSLVVLAVAFGLICFVVISRGSAPTFFELVWLLLPPLFIAYIFYLQPNRMASQAVLNEQLITEATWQVSDSGVEISSRFGSSQMEWETLSKLVITQDYYLLLSKVNKNAFRFLPLRAFSSPQEQAEFLNLVGKYIPVR